MKTKKTILPVLFLIILTISFYNCSSDGEDPATNSMEIVSINPESPSTLKFNEFVVITFNYNIVAEAGARMWIIPYTDGDRSPKYLYSSSKVFNGSGTRQVGISVESGNEPVKVDQIKINMVDPDQTETYIERFQNVDFTFE